MVDPTFLAIGAVVFFVVLIIILRSSAKEEPQKPSKKDRQKQKQTQQPKDKKVKKGSRGALKKNERSGIVSEWQVLPDSTSKDASEVLEFLKGKDPAELARQQTGTTSKQASKKKGKKAKEEAQSSDDSASEDVSLEGFEQVKKKPVGDKKNKNKKDKKQDEVKQAPAPKPYFRPLNPDGTPVKEEKPKKGERKPRIQREGDIEGQGERKPRPEGEKRERKPRPEGEQRERKEGDNERKPREPRPPREPREQKEPRRPITSPPNVKYEEANLDDLLNAITQDYKAEKAKPKVNRHPSPFSKIERSIVLKICAKLGARDLARLSRVNHYFMNVTRKDSLWKDLLARDFGIREFGKHRSFRKAYVAEYNKKHGRKGKKDEAAVPQGEEKDNKGKNNKKAQSSKEEVAQE